MSRTVSASIQTGMDAHITAPSYLIELMLDTPVYYSTMDAVTWNTHSWIAAAAKVLQLTDNGGRIELRNDDNSGSSLILNNITRDKEVRIYLYYNGDAEEVFRGYIGDSEIGAMAVTLDVLPSRIDKTLAPRKRVSGPVFTQILAPGQVIYWAGDNLRVES